MFTQAEWQAIRTERDKAIADLRALHFERRDAQLKLSQARTRAANEAATVRLFEEQVARIEMWYSNVERLLASIPVPPVEMGEGVAA